MTYNFHSSCKHMHLSFKSVYNSSVARGCAIGPITHFSHRALKKCADAPALARFQIEARSESEVLFHPNIGREKSRNTMLSLRSALLKNNSQSLFENGILCACPVF